MASIASAEQTTPVEITAPATNRAARILGPIAAGLAMLSAFATFVVLADLTPLAPTQNVVVTLLLINALTVFLLLGVIASEVWMVVQARRRGRAAARLHVRIVALFAVVAAVPTILVAVVASVTLDRGLDRLFSTRTKAIIENSLIVADAYLQEHAQMIRGDIMAMSFDVSRAKPLFDSDRERFKQFFSAQAKVRGLSSATILSSDAKVVEQADIKPQQSIPLPEAPGLVGVGQRRRLRAALNIGPFNDGGIGPNNGRSRQAANSRLRGEELLEPFALRIEQRLGASDIERHRHDVATDQLGMLLEISIGDDYRILDDRAGSCGEQPIETAIQRDAGHHRHQNRWHRRDDGKQAYDLDV
jgi:hypothetical protein